MAQSISMLSNVQRNAAIRGYPFDHFGASKSLGKSVVGGHAAADDGSVGAAVLAHAADTWSGLP